jgi:hypothetical protein
MEKLRTVTLSLAAVALLFVSVPAWAQPTQGNSVANAYTNALNALYAHGWHAPRHLTLLNGEVHAVAMSRNGQRQPVVFHPGTDSISVG